MSTAGHNWSPAESKQELEQCLADVDKEIDQLIELNEQEAEHRRARQERIAKLKARRVVLEQAFFVLQGHLPGGLPVEHH